MQCVQLWLYHDEIIDFCTATNSVCFMHVSRVPHPSASSTGSLPAAAAPQVRPATVTGSAVRCQTSPPPSSSSSSSCSTSSQSVASCVSAWERNACPARLVRRPSRRLAPSTPYRTPGCRTATHLGPANGRPARQAVGCCAREDVEEAGGPPRSSTSPQAVDGEGAYWVSAAQSQSCRNKS